MTETNELLAVLARAPELGSVKTRLCPPLSADEALSLHRALVEDTLELVGRLKRPKLAKLLLLSAPVRGADALHVPGNWTVAIQAKGDLGDRLSALFYSSFRREFTRIVAVGSDSPTLPVEVLEEAFNELGRSEVVLGPAADGGYYLVGASVFVPEMFSAISWGTSEVMSQTRHRLDERGRSFKLLIPWYDVDRPEDLERLRQEIRYLERSAPDLVPRRVVAALPPRDDGEFLSLDAE